LVMKAAIENPNNFVLKPQKEGGGNNFFDDEIPPLLQKMLQKPEEAGELLTYLIMERIVPPMIKFTSLRQGEIAVNDGLSELGIFSCVFTKNDSQQRNHKVLEYKNMGTLVRTKASHFNEGGVNSGFAVVDSPFVCPAAKFDWDNPKPIAQLQIPT